MVSVVLPAPGRPLTSNPFPRDSRQAAWSAMSGELLSTTCSIIWGVSSIQPDDGRCQMDRGEEISSGFVVTCRDSAEFLEVAEEVLNEVTRLESRFVIGALVFAIAPGWDHGGFSCGAKQVDHTLIGIECFVCQQSVSLHPRQQCVGAFQIMGFAR